MHMISAPATRAGLLIRLMRLKAGLEQEQLARLAGVSQSTVSRWESGLLRPAPKQAAALMDFVDAGSDGALAGARQALASWLNTPADATAGTPDPVVQQIERALSALAGVPPPVYDALIPYFADVAAGLGEAQEQRSLPRRWLEVPRGLYESDSGCYALRVVGDSMAPRLLAGDIVVVSPAAPLVDGCVVAAYVEPDGDVVKLYRQLPGGVVLLEPANPAYPCIKLGNGSEREARIWGRVVLQQREL